MLLFLLCWLGYHLFRPVVLSLFVDLWSLLLLLLLCCTFFAVVLVFLACWLRHDVLELRPEAFDLREFVADLLVGATGQKDILDSRRVVSCLPRSRLRDCDSICSCSAARSPYPVLDAISLWTTNFNHSQHSRWQYLQSKSPFAARSRSSRPAGHFLGQTLFVILGVSRRAHATRTTRRRWRKVWARFMHPTFQGPRRPPPHHEAAERARRQSTTLCPRASRQAAEGALLCLGTLV